MEFESQESEIFRAGPRRCVDPIQTHSRHAVSLLELQRAVGNRLVGATLRRQRRPQSRPEHAAEPADLSFVVVPSTFGREVEVFIPVGSSREIRPRNLAQMVQLILRAIGPRGHMKTLEIWDHGDPDVPGIAVGEDGITMESLDDALAILVRLRGHFARDGEIILHHCYAGGQGLPIMRAIARELRVPVRGGTGPSLGGPLTALPNIGEEITVLPSGDVAGDRSGGLRGPMAAFGSPAGGGVRGNWYWRGRTPTAPRPGRPGSAPSSGGEQP